VESTTVSGALRPVTVLRTVATTLGSQVLGRTLARWTGSASTELARRRTVENDHMSEMKEAEKKEGRRGKKRKQGEGNRLAVGEQTEAHGWPVCILYRYQRAPSIVSSTTARREELCAGVSNSQRRALFMCRQHVRRAYTCQVHDEKRFDGVTVAEPPRYHQLTVMG
jgi:hypothetical protein